MAAVEPAVKRIKYLLTGGDYQATPNTISMSTGGDHIKSYAMPIVVGHNGKRMVTGEYGVSATTDRHIRAAHAALRELGYERTGTIPGMSYQNPGHDGGLWDVYEMKNGA